MRASGCPATVYLVRGGNTRIAGGEGTCNDDRRMELAVAEEEGSEAVCWADGGGGGLLTLLMGRNGGQVYTLAIHCRGKCKRLKNVDQDKYSYIDFLSDIREIHNVCDDGMLKISCSVDDSEVLMNITGDKDVLNMFSRNKNRTEFEVFVELCGVDKGVNEGEYYENKAEIEEEGEDSENEGSEEVEGSENEELSQTEGTESGESESWDEKKSGEKSDETGDELSNYISDDHCESKNESDSDFEDDPLQGSLNREASVFGRWSDATKEASVEWIAGKIENVLRENPGMKPRGIKNELKKYGVNPQYMQIYRARKKAMGSIEGCHAESFGRLPYYAKIVLANNERSVVTLQCDVDESESIPHAPVFKRFFLAAIGLDGNNGLFPVAFAIAESECKESWGFFFENLSIMLSGFSCDKPWTFMSDRQKEVRKAYLRQFQRAVCRSSTKAYDWLLKIPAEMWSRHAFDERLKNDHVTNNISESFNHWVWGS
ncbi:hypothetical protein Sango_1158400 [Sesamum angolense]|uniref:MULE transposase domain-containing protein n=1 Tax=Sesamum angolense TaxID=2727404 RepID=A0AAE1WVK3_9LAMI|nr:hypothetical protein Sango_1158400 [Sesamum angolense]